MSDQTPSRPAYTIPADLGTVAHTALDGATDAHDQLGRAMVVVIAAAVRDILTGNEPDAPFDAAGLELVEAERGPLYPTGRYWTLAGEERTFTEAVGESEAGNGLHDMSEWTAYLDDHTRYVWYPLCTELPDRDGCPAYRLDLLKAAAVPLAPPAPEPASPARPLSAMVDVTVCANDEDRYPAKVDPEDQKDGYVKPWFDLDTVRRLAALTQADAAAYGHGSIDTVHVLEGSDANQGRDGSMNVTRYAVVVVVSWMYLNGEKHERAVEVLQPNAEGRYAVGGHDWCWYALDDDLNPQIPFML
ncbi:hypothetical protein [Streptomyces sp. Root369]|uniref:hypothetical protein n=1 Tax=Streptomyces sp. Root369 TaxID=1736523 RepID=UPI0007092915|nr:hypothetical protein [Streptomyces sp. Root369]KQW13539.1 hypothetical protein ASD08_30700 [Streptomyces sp. Root369]